MNSDHKMPILSFVLFAAAITAISGFAAQVCRIGHGGILPVGILTPYAALLFLHADFDALYAAILSVATLRGVLRQASLVVFLAHCIGIVVVFSRTA